MKFKFIGINLKDESGNPIASNAYQGYKVLNGDIIELNDYFSAKARKNPDYEIIEDIEIASFTEVKPQKRKYNKKNKWAAEDLSAKIS